MRKGFTLIEVILAVLLSAIALFGITTLIILANNDWRESKEIVALQTDLDLASYTLKGILEEADTVGIPEETHITAGYKTDWQKEFYQDEDKLMLKDITNPGKPEEEIIDSLKSILFQEVHSNLLKVDLNVERKGRELSNSFIIYLRNK